jgi:type I restriction enzyme S subunit
VASLDHLLELIIDHRGQTPKKLRGGFSPVGVPVLSARNVKGGGIVDEGELRYVDIGMWHRWMPIKLQVGDVLLTSEAPLGEAALLDGSTEYCLGQRLFALRVDRSQLLGEYLYYWLQSDEGRRELERRASGTTAQGIRKAELVEVEIDLPPVPRQQDIVTVLQAIDRGVSSNRRLARSLEELFIGLFRLWFTALEAEEFSGLAEQIPDGLLPTGWQDTNWRAGWTTGVLGDAGKQQRIGVVGGAAEPDEPYFGLEHLPRRRLTVEAWGRAGDAISNKFRLAQGDILFGKLRPYFHKVVIAPTSGVCSTDILVLQPVSPEWLGFFLGHVSSPELIEYVDAASGGTRMPRTNWQTIADYSVEIPPLPVARHFTEAVAPILERLQSLVWTNGYLAEIRALLLGPLMSGELAPEKVPELVLGGLPR